MAIFTASLCAAYRLSSTARAGSHRRMRSTTSHGQSWDSSRNTLSGDATLDGGRNITVSPPPVPSYINTDVNHVPLDVLSAALDAGTAIGAILVFFVLQYPGNGSIGKTSVEQWWGNTVWRNTADMRGVPFKTLEGSGRKHFGCVHFPRQCAVSDAVSFSCSPDVW